MVLTDSCVYRAIVVYFLQTHSGNDYMSPWVWNYDYQALTAPDCHQPNHNISRFLALPELHQNTANNGLEPQG